MKARGYARQELNHHRMLKQLSNKSPSRLPPQPFMILRYTTKHVGEHFARHDHSGKQGDKLVAVANAGSIVRLFSKLQVVN